MSLYFHLVIFFLNILICHGLQTKEYVYDRAICTGLGDRMGDIMNLATLARIHSVQIVFEWCTDVSVIFPRIRKHIPRFTGWQYDLSEFEQRFQIPSDIILVHNFTLEQKQSFGKVKYEGLEVPSEAGLNIIYTTGYKTVGLNHYTPDGEHFKMVYHQISSAIVHHVKMYDPIVLAHEKQPYLVVHMRGGDHNNYEPFLGCHDHYQSYCTGKVLKKLLKKLEQNVKIFAITNNGDWFSSILKNSSNVFKSRIELVNGTSASDDFALMLGAVGIVQHALHGWSSYSTVAAMMAQIPLITTYKTTMQHHRYETFKQYGGVPSELYTCDRQNAFFWQIKHLF